MTHKILYVEDNPDNMRLIEKVLTARGYEVYGAEMALPWQNNSSRI
jgi:CheY-like chemotaxis protein